MTLIYFIVFPLGPRIQILYACLCRFKLRNLHTFTVTLLYLCRCMHRLFCMLLLDHLGERERMCVRFRIMFFSHLEALVTTYYLNIHSLKRFDLCHLWDPSDTFH